MKQFVFAMLGMILLAASPGAAELLLSDNEVGNCFYTGIGRIRTGATLEWVTEGEFGTRSAELLKTGSRPDGRCRVLLDGVRGTSGDGQAFGNWGKQYYGTFTIDLKAPYLIRKASIWSQQTKTQGFESLEILLSTDGKNFISAGKQNAPPDLLNAKDKLAERFDFTLEKPAVARYVQFRVKKHPARMQMILAEAAVWGERAPEGAAGIALRPENCRPQPEVTCSAVGSGAVKLRWKALPQALRYRIFRSTGPFAEIGTPAVQPVAELSADKKEFLLYPLRPGETVHLGVSAVYPEGEANSIGSVAFRAPELLAGDTLGELLAINHFWGGGGARHRARSREWETVALDLLADTPFKEVRWWESHPEIVLKLYERGIGMSTFSAERNFRNGARLGIYLYGSGNEPHLHGVTPEQHAERVKAIFRQARAADPANRIYAPTVCLDRHSLDFLKRFYASGAKEFFDVLDVHTYLGNTADFVYPAGYPTGSPEGLFERIGQVKAVMAEYGDAQKALISTEYGFTDCNVANPVGAMTPERKAAFLVRGLLIHHVLGFKKVYVYSFWDEGEDENYTEHFFGIVDYKLQKKPAFYALQTLGRVLGEMRLRSAMTGADPTNFGYVYSDGSGKRFATVVWNGASDMTGKFRTLPGTVRLTEMGGRVRTLRTAADGTFRAVYGPAPLYLESGAPVELLEKSPCAERGKAVSDTTPELHLADSAVVALPGREVRIEGNFISPVSGEVVISVENSEKRKVAEVKLQVKADKVADFSIPLPAARSGVLLDVWRVSVRQELPEATFSQEKAVYVRRLSGRKGVFPGTMHGYDKEIFTVGNGVLELTVDPARGGRILDLYDLRSGANQITTPYDRIGTLDNIAFAYCIWDQVKAPTPFAIGRNAAFRPEILKDGLRLTAASQGGLELSKTLRLAAPEQLSLDVQLTNHSAGTVRCSWYLHPEYTVGGSADSHSDTLHLPIGGAEQTIPYWTGLGARETPAFSDGYWILRDPVANYEIRQEFDPAAFRKPRLWFGIGCCNLEMESREGLMLPAGGIWQGTLHWFFRKIK